MNQLRPTVLRRIALGCMIAMLPLAASAASGQLNIGMNTALCGPGAGLGIDIRDGFNLAAQPELWERYLVV